MGRKKVSPNPKILFIRSQDGKEAEEVKTLVKSEINPREIGVRIKRLRKTPKGGMIETEDASHVTKIELSDTLKAEGRIAERLKKRNPRLMFHDVDSDEPDDMVIENV